MNFKKNIQFTLLIRAEKRLHEFNFRKRSDELFDADVSDDRGERHFFKLVKEEGAWKVDQVGNARWIVNAEEGIVKAVNDADKN